MRLFETIIVGPYPFVFWLGQLGLAGVLPFVMVGAALSRVMPVPASVPSRTLPLQRPVPAIQRVARLGLAPGIVLVIAVLGAVDLLLLVPGLAPGVAAATELGFWQGWASLRNNGLFWAAQLALLSLVIGWVAQRWGSVRFWLGAAGFSTVLGIMAVRLNIVIPGFVLPVLEHLDRAYQDLRLSYSYFPAVIEWATTVGLVALVALLFSLAYQLLPVYSRQEEAA